MEERIATTIRALKKNNFIVHFVPTADRARQLCLEILKEARSISRGGSISLEQIGLIDQLIEGGYPFRDYKTPEERRASIFAQYYLCSSNALSEEGELINVDGAGNRIAALSYGPERIIVVVGKNKIVVDRAAGLARIKSIAGPLNALRLKKDTPCVKTGTCMDCDKPDRICRKTHILSKPEPGRVIVIIVDEDLGF